MKTIRRIFRLLVIVTWLGGWVLAASALYIVRTPGTGGRPNLTIVPKDHLGFANTFTDVRNWSLADAHHHRAVVEQMIHSGKADQLAHIGTIDQLQAANEPVPAWTDHPTTLTAPPIKSSAAPATDSKTSSEKRSIFD
jgi:hypothetical protein